MRAGDKTIWPPLVLAPMAGLTHSALRRTIFSFGGVGLFSTEMLSASRLPAENSTISPYLIKTPEEQPLSCQVLLNSSKPIARAFAALHRYGADLIDINLGCPAPLVRKSGGGSSLMEDMALVRDIVRCARKHTHLPLSAKIRLGEELCEQSLRDFCCMLVDEGIDLLGVHARLRRESFARPPRWEWVGKVKNWLAIPVLANGSIDSVASARACLAQSGADGLMIGRAAAVKPWIFAQIAREVYGVEMPEPRICLPAVYRNFADGLQLFPRERRLGRLKEFSHYFAKNYFFGHYLAAAVQSSHSMEQALARAEDFFDQHEGSAL